MSISDEDWVIFGFFVPLSGIIWTLIIMGFLSMNEEFLQSHVWLELACGGLFLGFFGFAFASMILLFIRTVIVKSKPNIKRGKENDEPC